LTCGKNDKTHLHLTTITYISSLSYLFTKHQWVFKRQRFSARRKIKPQRQTGANLNLACKNNTCLIGYKAALVSSLIGKNGVKKWNLMQCLTFGLLSGKITINNKKLHRR
jgi:hypothetical protein